MKSKIIIWMCMFILLLIPVMGARNDYLQLLDTDKYTIEDGRYTTHCKDCEMDLRFCRPADLVNDTFNMKTYTRDRLQTSLLDHATNFKIFGYVNLNGTADWRQASLTQAKNYIKNMNVDDCIDIKLMFTMNDGEEMDIVPEYNSIAYEEYAYFVDSGLSTNSSYYFSFDNNTYQDDSTLFAHRVNLEPTPPLRTELIGVINSPDYSYSNTSSWVFVNSSSNYPYGRIVMDNDNDGERIDMQAPELNYTVSDSFYAHIWFKATTFNQTDKAFMVYFLKNSPRRTRFRMYTDPAQNGAACVEIRSELLSDSAIYCGSSNVTDNQHHLFIFTYDAIDQRVYMVIDNNVEVNISKSVGYVQYWDSLADENYRLGGTNLPTPGSFDWHGELGEFHHGRGRLEKSEWQKIWETSNRSSFIERTFIQGHSELDEGIDYEYDYNWTDRIDTLTYSVNDTRFDVSNTGIINNSDISAGWYDITVNVTDGFDNWQSDTFSLNVTGFINQLPIITEVCPDTTIFHNQNLNCIFNATDGDGHTLSWSVNDTRVIDNQINNAVIITDNPSILDFNLPECWDIEVSVNDGFDTVSDEFQYCINNSAPVFDTICSNTTLSFQGVLNCSFSMLDFESDDITFSSNDSIIEVFKTGTLNGYGYDDTLINESGCYNIEISGTDSIYSDSFTFEYCIQNTAPILTDNSFSKNSFDYLESVIYVYTPSDNESDNVIVSVQWNVNGLLINQSITNPVLNIQDNIILDKNVTSIGDTIFITLNISDGYENSIYSDSVSITDIPDTQLLVNTCPDTIPGQMSLWLVVFICLFFIAVGMIANIGVFGFFGGLGLLVVSWSLVACQNTIGFLVAVIGIFCIIYFTLIAKLY